MIKFNSLLLVLTFLSCAASTNEDHQELTSDSNPEVVDSLPMEIEEPLYCNEEVQVGAERMSTYLEKLKGKRVGVVGNQSSVVGHVHLVDTLLASGIEVVKVFSPEHGFRGKADAGEKVKSDIDSETGLPIVSLYGSNRKPKADQLADIDVLMFDIQDVGVRFYTYISTLHYVMEAAAENDKPLIVLDRPNPNGHYVDGPTLKKGYDSFVGMHEIPVVHGMTVGEYAQMVNGEGWLENGVQCELEVITCEGWDHSRFYELPIAPSPNLPNMTSVYLYPGLCFFEGTTVSIGRGTDHPFQIIGHPDYPSDSLTFEFVPEPKEGAKKPKLLGETCYGIDLHEIDVKEFRENKELDLTFVIDFYAKMNKPADFFLENNFINLLAGSGQLQEQIKTGLSMPEIRETWRADLELFKEVRAKYLLYSE